jgi:hypothetical protein
MSIERAFTIVAALLVFIAAVFLWRDNISAAFVMAALGAVAWFLSYRFRLRAAFPVTDDEVESIEDVNDEIRNSNEDGPSATR